MIQQSQFSSCQSGVPPAFLQNQEEDFIQLLNRVDELYFNYYECPESEVYSDVENVESDNVVDYVEHFVEPSVDVTRDMLLRQLQRILW
jgi:hypothetical protein